MQECIAISMQAANKLNQTYTFVTMDLAAAKIAFDIKFDDSERFSPVIIHFRLQIYIPVYALCTTICNRMDDSSFWTLVNSKMLQSITSTLFSSTVSQIERISFISCFERNSSVFDEMSSEVELYSKTLYDEVTIS